MMCWMARVRSDEIALRSADPPVKPRCATSWATSSAACGGQTDSTMSLALTSAGTVPASSRLARRARAHVLAVRPAEAQSTVCPLLRTAAPTDAPIAPGCMSPMHVMSSSPAQVGEAMHDVLVNLWCSSIQCYDKACAAFCQVMQDCGALLVTRARLTSAVTNLP